MKKYLLLMGVVLAMTPWAVSAQTETTTTTTATTTVALPDPGLVPGDFFYFLDRWGEAINSFFTFNPTAKARLALEHAQERAAELGVVLQKKGAGSSDTQALSKDFQDDLGTAVAAVSQTSQNNGTTTASTLAKEVGNEIEASKDMLKEVYNNYHATLQASESDLREKLKNAITSGATTTAATLSAELKHITDERLKAVGDAGSVDQNFTGDEKSLDDVMGIQQSAEVHITNAERARAQILAQAAVRGATVATSTLAAFDAALSKAQGEFKAGSFEAARNDAMNAERMLQDAHRLMETQQIRNDAQGYEDEFMNASTSSVKIRVRDEYRGASTSVPTVPGRPGALRVKDAPGAVDVDMEGAPRDGQMSADMEAQGGDIAPDGHR